MSGEKLTLNCLVWPDDEPDEHLVEVEVEVDNNWTVLSLKGLITKRHAHALAHIDDRDLVLWKCFIPVDNNLRKTLNTVRFDGTDTRLVRLPPISPIFEHFATDLSHKTIHILAEIPHKQHAEASNVVGNRAENTNSSRKQPLADAGHIIENWQSKRLMKRLPSLDELIGALKEPLLDSEKIPITQSMYSVFVSRLPPDMCDKDALITLFKIGELDPGLLGVYTAISTPPPIGGTEQSFIAFWDNNIRHLIECLIPDGGSIRHSNQRIETHNLRPDYGFLLNQICSFRGEETAPGNSEDLKAELAAKVNWVYMLGYYCRGFEMTLVANIRHLINLSAILPRLTEIVRYPVNDSISSRFEITSTLIIKTYTCPNAKAKVNLLQGIYEVIATRHVPNTDALVFANKNVAHLGPRGIAGQLVDEKELRECVICILESLIVAHQVPLYHRDIRWSNIICRIEDHSKWFLIDWEDAASPHTTAQQSFARWSHSPAVFEDNHGADVDIWGVGYLIKTCRVAGVSMEFRFLGTDFARNLRA